MGLLERRRLLLQNAAENALDGKYVTFVQLNTSSNSGGQICLSSDYGHTFEVIHTGNLGTVVYQHPDVAIDVVGGKPIVYFTSGSAGKSAIYRWKDGVVDLYLTCPNNYYVNQFLTCLDHDVLLNLDVAYDKIYLLYSGSVHTYPDALTRGGYIKSPIKVRRKEGAVLFGTYLDSTGTYADIWWGKYTTPETFKLSSGSAYHMTPSGTKPIGYIEDFDISPDGNDAVLTTLQGGAIIGNNLTSNPSWYHIPHGQLGVPNYSILYTGVAYSDNKSFLGYRTGSYSVDSRVNRYSNHVIVPVNLEITGNLPAPQGTSYAGIYTMSLWSDTSGKNLVSLNKGYANRDTYMAYSSDAGLTWTRSSHMSGSGLVIASADVYRL